MSNACVLVGIMETCGKTSYLLEANSLIDPVAYGTDAGGTFNQRCLTFDPDIQ